MSALSIAEHADYMAAYEAQGEQLALQLGNRGPLRRDASGRVHQEILDAYWQHGFYVH